MMHRGLMMRTLKYFGENGALAIIISGISLYPISLLLVFVHGAKDMYGIRHWIWNDGNTLV